MNLSPDSSASIVSHVVSLEAAAALGAALTRTEPAKYTL